VIPFASSPVFRWLFTQRLGVSAMKKDYLARGFQKIHDDLGFLLTCFSCRAIE